MKKLKVVGGILLSVGAMVAKQAVAQSGPPTGVVYGCYSSSASGPSFVLVDGSNYQSRQGGTGKYSYNAGNGVLTILSGPYVGIRYLKVDASYSFRVLRGDTMEMSTISCPINKGKDPNKRPW